MDIEPLLFGCILGLSFLGFIIMIIPTKTEKGSDQKMKLFLICGALIWIILIVGKLCGVIPDAEGDWSELP